MQRLTEMTNVKVAFLDDVWTQSVFEKYGIAMQFFVTDFLRQTSFKNVSYGTVLQIIIPGHHDLNPTSA